MEARLAIFVSVISLFIASLSYFRPKKPGGATQWAIEIDEKERRAYLKQVGFAKARNVSVTIDSTLSENEIRKSFSFPNDVIPLPLFRTLGKPNVNIKIKWTDAFRISHKREFDI
jgi:hypothetical protein